MLHMQDRKQLSRHYPVTDNALQLDIVDFMYRLIVNSRFLKIRIFPYLLLDSCHTLNIFVFTLLKTITPWCCGYLVSPLFPPHIFVMHGPLILKPVGNVQLPTFLYLFVWVWVWGVLLGMHISTSSLIIALDVREGALMPTPSEPQVNSQQQLNYLSFHPEYLYTAF